MGMIVAEERKYAPVLRNVINARNSPMTSRVVVAHFPYKLVDIIVGVVCKYFLKVSAVPFEPDNVFRCTLGAEKNLQDRDDGCERENVQHRRQYVENHRKYQIFLIWRYKAV